MPPRRPPPWTLRRLLFFTFVPVKGDTVPSCTTGVFISEGQNSHLSGTRVSRAHGPFNTMLTDKAWLGLECGAHSLPRTVMVLKWRGLTTSWNVSIIPGASWWHQVGQNRCYVTRLRKLSTGAYNAAPASESMHRCVLGSHCYLNHGQQVSDVQQGQGSKKVCGKHLGKYTSKKIKPRKHRNAVLAGHLRSQW